MKVFSRRDASATVALVAICATLLTVGSAPYQANIVDATPSFSILPPSITITLVFRNDAILPVRVGAVLRFFFKNC